MELYLCHNCNPFSVSLPLCQSESARPLIVPLLQTGEVCSNCVLKDHRQHRTELADEMVDVGSELARAEQQYSDLQAYSDGIKKVGHPPCRVSLSRLTMQ